MDNIQENEFENIDELDEISDEELLEDEASVETKDDSQLNLSSSENDGNDSSNFQNILQTEPITQIQEVVPSYEPLPNEIGKVKNIGTENINITVTSKQALEKNLIDHHVIFKTNDNKKIVGTLISLDSNEGKVKLIGEIQGFRFVPGVLNKPAIGNICFIATDEETKLIVADEQGNNVIKKVLVGSMPLYNNTPAYVPTNTFFSNHFAIFGNTGSGKSCGVARLFQNVFFNQPQAPKNACVFIFDAYGEYESALSIQNSQIYFKKYSTNVRTDKQNIIKLPLWLLDIDDFALLLEVDDPTQLPIIEKALRLVTIFAGNEEDTKVYKNDIIAKAILEVLYSGGSASQIHDQIFAILTSFNTTDLNLETPIVQPGYVRSLKQCLIIDKEGKIGEIGLVTEFIKKFINPDLRLELPDGTIPFTLENLREAFDFALISEGTLKSDKMYDKANVLKVRLDSFIKGEYAEYFKMDKYVDKNTFIKELITAPNGGRAQIININISYLDDRLAKTICKIYAKLLFDFTSKLGQRGSFPVHLILEEAHRYVQQDSDTKILGYNIFDRIAKEGRKYGVILGLISQRPSEMSETVLSQCSNFLIFKMQHPKDVSFIKQMVPFITDEIVEKMKGLQPGTCVVFGSAFKLPTIVKMEMPYPQPMSQNVDVSRLWY
ncbi:MAG: ATP-binding protein [Candidatus Aphodocola sp.]